MQKLRVCVLFYFHFNMAHLNALCRISFRFSTTKHPLLPGLLNIYLVVYEGEVSDISEVVFRPMMAALMLQDL